MTESGALGPDAASYPVDSGPAPDGGSVCVMDGGPGVGQKAGVLASGAGTTTNVAQAVSIDGSKGGRVFDGIGAISGGGGNSRLLFDYPEPYRSEVLDYLFKPSYGAGLQILKVEIGGDANSTDGSEPSIMHTSTDLACNRGWEFWLMREAKKRNPDIKLYGLSWGAPGWITGGFMSNDTIRYLLKWLDCAKTNGFVIDYIGGQNERGYDKGWYERLKTAIIAGGYKTQIVGGDGGWDVADDMVSDPAFASAIDIVGAHYPCGGDGSDAITCASTSNALKTGKPLWASENGSRDYNTGAAAIARAILRGYIDGQMTSFINWPLLASIPPGLPFETVGLMVANSPWSGAFDVGKSLWVTSQVTQFAKPGWRFVDSASGYIGGNRTNGTVAVLKSDTGQDYTALIETSTAGSAQTIAFSVTNRSAGDVHVWGTNLAADDKATDLVHMVDIVPSSGTFWIKLEPGYLYSVTTTSGQAKGEAMSPPLAAAALPYRDDFEGRAVATPPRYLCDQDGSFEIARCAASRPGLCLRQAAPATPIEWANHYGTPSTILGTNEWRDYSVSADVLLEAPGSVELTARYGARDYYNTGRTDGYALSVNEQGAWSILRNDATDHGPIAIASGAISSFGTMKWHSLAFKLAGSVLSASIDGVQVGTTNDTTYDAGPAGLAVGITSGKWSVAQFDNLAIDAVGPLVTPHTNAIVNRATGKLLDVAGSSTTDGALMTLSDYSGRTSQLWQLLGVGSGALQIANLNSGKALSVSNGDALSQEPRTSDINEEWQVQSAGGGFFRILGASGHALGARDAGAGAAVVTSAPDCSDSQEWSLTVMPVTGFTYQVVNRASGLLLDVVAAATQSGGAVDLWPTTGGANQSWLLRQAGTSSKVMFENRNSGMVLEVPDARTDAGAPLDQGTANGGDNQIWEVRPTKNGYVVIVGSDGLFVDAKAGSPTKGSVVVQAAPSGAPSQEWSLVTAP